jgi:hypothetical protein
MAPVTIVGLFLAVWFVCALPVAAFVGRCILSAE